MNGLSCLRTATWFSSLSFSSPAGLPDDPVEGSPIQLMMVGNRDGDRAMVRSLLHHQVAAALSYQHKAVSCEQGADGASRKDAEPTQSEPPTG